MTTEQADRSRGGNPWLNRTVLGASLTSALGDIAHESTTTVLPGFMAVLGVPAAPALLGTIEGLSDATASFTKLGAGFLSDRLGHRKPMVVIGYALTAGAQAFYALALGWPLILLGRMIAWFGRGIRGPLRDAILAEAITPATRGRAFGFHRAADTLGAVVGPLLGAGVLTLLQRGSPATPTSPFRVVFWLSLIPGFLSVLSFAVLVREERRGANHAMRFWTTVRSLPGAFRKYLVAVGIFGAGDFAPTLLILAATQLLTPRLGVTRAAQVAAALYVWRNIIYAATSFPVGYLGDRLGPRRVLAAGYALGAATAICVAVAFAIAASHLGILIGIFTLAGVYIAVEDSLERSMTAEFVPVAVRGTGYGVLGTVNGVGDFISSTLVGTLWATVSPVVGFSVAAALMAAGTVAMAVPRRSWIVG